MEIKDAYTTWSVTYDSDRNLTRDLDQRVTKDTFMGLRYETILELGCGTGKNTSLFAEIGDRVLGLDLSIGMLNKARAKTKSDHVTLAIADLAKTWPCRDESFALIVCNLVLEHVQDLSAVFSEANRVLLPKGQFFISELHPYRQYQGAQPQFHKGQNRIQVQAFVHHLSDFTNPAAANGLSLMTFSEWWHEADQSRVPRLVTFMFEKPAESLDRM